MSRVHTSPIVGLPEAGIWSQVVEHSHADLDVSCVFSVSGARAKSVSRTVTQAVKSARLTSPEALHRFVRRIQSEAVRERCSLACACAVLLEDQALFAAYQGMVYLKRGERIGKLLSAPDEIQLLTGQLQRTDVLVLATDAAQVFVEELKLKYEQGYTTDAVITSMISGIQSATDAAGCSLAFVGYSEQPAEQQEVFEQAVAVPESNAPEQLGAQVELESSHAEQAVPQRSSRLQASLNSKLQFISTALQALRTQLKNLHLPFSSAVYVQRQPARWVRLLLLLTVAALIIGGMVFFFLRNQRLEREQAEVSVAPFRQELQQAQAIVGQDPLSAREQVAAVVSKLEELSTSTQKSGVAAEYVAQELTRARQVYEDISGKEELSELPVFYDLRLIRSDFVATLAQGSGSFAVFLDAGKQQAAVLDLASKQVAVLDVANVGEIRSAALTQDTLLILGSGIWEVELDAEAVPVEVIASGDSNSEAQFLNAYESFLYVLNPVKRNIYRYLKEDGEYSQPVGWLQSSLGLTLDSVTSVAIDGDIWLATSTGEVRKFTSGREQEFSVAGMAQAFDSPIELVTSPTLQHLYVLEPQRHRLVVLSKEGTFLREMKSQSLGSASSLVVSEELGRAFVLSGSMVFELEL